MLSSLESDFNPCAMRTELSFNLPYAVLFQRLTAISQAEAASAFLRGWAYVGINVSLTTRIRVPKLASNSLKPGSYFDGAGKWN